jgi:hypothetical protein
MCLTSQPWFDTNNQKIDQISKCDSSHKKSGHCLGVKFNNNNNNNNHLFAQQNHIPITGQKEREIQTYLNSRMKGTKRCSLLTGMTSLI